MKKPRKPQPQFVVCIDNRDYPASLELRKIYRVLSDQDAKARKLMRVVDESGEDYLYPTRYFLSVSLPKSIQRAVMLAS